MSHRRDQERASNMPSCASAKHMEDDALMHEQQVTLNLVVELVWYLHTAYFIMARLGPLATYLARLGNLRHELQDAVGNADLLDKAMPELAKVTLGFEAPAPLILVERPGPRRSFVHGIAALARVPVVEALGDALYQSALQGAPREFEFEGGRCACGALRGR